MVVVALCFCRPASVVASLVTKVSGASVAVTTVSMVTDVVIDVGVVAIRAVTS